MTTHTIAEVVLDGRGEHRRVLAEAAVADQRHHGAVGGGELGADGGRRPEPHGGEAARGEDGAGRADRELLADAVLVPADVGGDVGVVGQLGPRRRPGSARASSGTRRWWPSPGCRRRTRPGRRRCARRPRAARTRPGRARGRPGSARPSAAAASATTPISVGKLRPISLGSMSMWISAVGGMSKVKPRYHELLSASLNRVPMASMTSAARQVSLTSRVPQKPVMPSTSGWSSPRAPLPIRLWATGMPMWSTKRSSSSLARDRRTPPPT